MSIYFAVDALSHMNKSLEIQKQLKSFCGGIEIVNCTSMALKSVVESAQHMLIAIVELFVSAIFLLLAFYLACATIKILIGPNN
jgi:hypothetical protein